MEISSAGDMASLASFTLLVIADPSESPQDFEDSAYVNFTLRELETRLDAVFDAT